MSKDFIPDSDADFDAWLNQFISGIRLNMVNLGLTQTTVDTVVGAATNWREHRQVRIDADATAHSAAVQQKSSRDVVEGVCRSTAHLINGSDGVDNAMRAKVALPSKSEVRSTIGVPETKPQGRTESKTHYKVILHFVDETTPLRTAKPHGVHGCRIYRFIGETPPADISGYTFLSLDTKTPYEDVHTAADAGKSVYYLLRWENTKGEVGPVSDVITTRIPA